MPIQVGVDVNNNDLRALEDVAGGIDAVSGQERRCVYITSITRVSCSVIQHSHSEESLMAKDGSLSFAPMQDEDPAFLFSYQVISGLYECGRGQPVCIFDFNTRSNSRTFVVGDTPENNVGLRCLSPLSPEATTLDEADPRFFIHHWVAHAYSLLESLKHREYYLARDEARKCLVLKPLTNRQDQAFHFTMKPLEN